LKDLADEFAISMDALKQEMYHAIENSQKMKSDGDNIGKPWNNGMNDRREEAARPVLRPAYYNAERSLLAAMLQDPDVTQFVQERLGDEFNIEAHAALAAYIYRYYLEHDTLELSTFLRMLQDDELERLTTSIAMMDPSKVLNEQALEDYIHQIWRAPLLLEIEQKKEQMHRAEQSGDVELAVQIGSEIITLERKLKETKQ